MTARLYLVRHGQAQWQVAPDDDLDSPLTALGHAQAGALAKRLGDDLGAAGPARAVRMFTSPLLRARQTVGYVEAELGIRAEILAELAEARFRVADHLRVRDRPFGEEPSPLHPAYAAFRDQAAAALRQLYQASLDAAAPVVAMTHGGLIKTLLRCAAGSDRICFEVGNASVTALEWGGGYWRVACLNCRSHLQPAARTS